MLIPIDERRDLIVPGNHETTLNFCVEHFLFLANEAILRQGHFFVALFGGSTPEALFQKLCAPAHRSAIDWSRVSLFWSDERSVPPDHADSNYRMAMEAGFKALPIPTSQVHRMVAEHEIEKHAKDYEKTIQKALGRRPFDLIMLGMGDDGHTASLFPNTPGLKNKERLVIAQYIPQKETWRMTFTFDLINSADQTVVYVLGASKKEMLAKILLSPFNLDQLPSQGIGSKNHKALWIADEAAAKLVLGV